MPKTEYKYLDKIDYPSDLRKMNEDDLIGVCNDLRNFIIDAVSCNPAHFGASLGVVELSVALHYVFNTPYDHIIWDVGHQAYGHKILTGRKSAFHTNRKYKGISGFPKRSESEYDSFGVGHSSTSISAALGMAIAAQKNNEADKQVVAIIGDGSMTAGLAYEGLNNASVTPNNLLIILNDNNMAIDPNVGGISEYLTDIATSKTYNKMRREMIRALSKLKIVGPRSREMIIKVNNNIKTLLTKQHNIFEGFNLRYFGPMDGHDVNHLVKVLNDLKTIKGPKLLHIKTKKGKGFKLAELNQTAWHAPSQKFDKITGEFISTKNNKPAPPRFQDVFGYSLTELAKKNKKIIGITPAMPTGCSLNIMMEEMPDRVFDVGIAEQHAVTFSAGLAVEGYIPFCNIYSSFMQRAYDQVIHDVAIQKLQVIFCLDRGGLVGADGATHHGAYDIAFLRSVPGLIIGAPMDEIDLRNMMFTAQARNHGPFSIRYPRGKGFISDWKKEFEIMPVGKGRKLTDGKDIAILTIGAIGTKAQFAIRQLNKENVNPAHYDMRFVKPLDEELLHEIFQRYSKVLTVEDGAIVGGFGSAVLEFMAENNYHATVKRLGIPDKYIDQGSQLELYRECGYDASGIKKEVLKLLKPELSL